MSDREAKRLSLAVGLDLPGFRLTVERDLNLDGVTGLFGPSGSGKTTLLRIIAGLENGASGSVGFADDTWQDTASGTFVPPHHRPIGYVFQHARLFTHLDVAGNLEFARRRSPQIDGSVTRDDVVSAMNIGDLLPRRVEALSGGERQRVAIARTLLTQPQLLLLDEPLSSLDVGHRNEILPYLENLYRRFGIPAIFVSHTIGEMARLADKVIVLDEGRVSAVGSANVVLSREDLLPSALPFEAMTVFEVTVDEHMTGLGLTRVLHDCQPMTVPALPDAAKGDRVRLSVRAGDVVLATREPRELSVRNVLQGAVSGIAPLPDSAFAIVTVDISGTLLKAQLTRHAIDELRLARGTPVYALVKTATFDRGV